MVETLEKYRNKRHFKQTPEPGGGGSAIGSGRSFVIHEHHARRLHFDLRLEMNGILKSWAVPKGWHWWKKRNQPRLARICILMCMNT